MDIPLLLSAVSSAFLVLVVCVRAILICVHDLFCGCRCSTLGPRGVRNPDPTARGVQMHGYNDYSLPAVTLDEGEPCLVCGREFTVGVEIGVTACNHVFHGSCIYRWQSMSCLCPLCAMCLFEDQQIPPTSDGLPPAASPYYV